VTRWHAPPSWLCAFRDEDQPRVAGGQTSHPGGKWPLSQHSQRIYVSGDIHTNTAEGFFGHFKTDIRGTHHSMSERWLDSYLTEWCWKWNHRDDDEAMFRSLLANAATGCG
jgi:hypothetical protein